MEKQNMNTFFDNPAQLVGLVIVVVVAVGVGLSILSATYSGLGSSGVSYIDTFPVSDPSVAQTVNLTATPDASAVIVTQYNGYTWVTVSSAFYTVNVNQVTVQPGGMQG